MEDTEAERRRRSKYIFAGLFILPVGSIFIIIQLKMRVGPSQNNLVRYFVSLLMKNIQAVYPLLWISVYLTSVL